MLSNDELIERVAKALAIADRYGVVGTEAQKQLRSRFYDECSVGFREISENRLSSSECEEIFERGKDHWRLLAQVAVCELTRPTNHDTNPA